MPETLTTCLVQARWKSLCDWECRILGSKGLSASAGKIGVASFGRGVAREDASGRMVLKTSTRLQPH